MPHLPIPELLLGAIPNTPDAYLVGGAVRDMLMQRRSTDVDIVVDGNAAAFADLVAARVQARVVPIGKPGQTTYRVTSHDILIDITGLAGESLEDDLRRRDFTVNAMAYHLHDHRLVDILNGGDDIDRRQIRMVSEQAFIDDPLRLLRAFRMAAVLGFIIEPETLGAVQRHSHRIQQPAGERQRVELIQLLACPTSARHVREMSKSGLLTGLLPEMQPLIGCGQNKHHDFDVYDHTLRAYTAIEQCLQKPERLSEGFEKRYRKPPFRRTTAAILKYAVLLHDIGKPEKRRVATDGAVSFHGHAKHSAALAEAVHARLRLSKRESEQARIIIANHGRPLSLFSARRAGNLSPKGINRLFRECDPWTPEVLLHALGDTLGKKETPDRIIAGTLDFIQGLLDDYFDRYRPLADQKPLIGGQDLMKRFDLAPGAMIGELLTHIEDERLAGGITTREEALLFADALLTRKHRSD